MDLLGLINMCNVVKCKFEPYFLFFDGTRKFVFSFVAFGSICKLSFFFQALEEKGPKKQAEEKCLTPRLSLPCCLAAAFLSHSLSEVFEHLDVKKISFTIFSAVKKGKA